MIGRNAPREVNRDASPLGVASWQLNSTFINNMPILLIMAKELTHTQGSARRFAEHPASAVTGNGIPYGHVTPPPPLGWSGHFDEHCTTDTKDNSNVTMTTGKTPQTRLLMFELGEMDEKLPLVYFDVLDPNC